MPQARLAGLLALGLATAGAVASLARPLAPALPAVATDLATFTPATLAAVEQWVGPVRVGFLAATALELAAVGALLGTRRGRRLVDRVGGAVPGGRRRGGRWSVARGAVLAQVAAAVAALPVRAWVGHVHATDVGLRTGSAAAWVVEWVGTTALRTALVAGGLQLLAVLVVRRPRGWPALATLGATAAAAVLLLLEPMVTSRLLLAPVPLEDATTLATVDEVLASSALADVPVVVGQASRRTTAVNAYVTGLGPTRRVLLHDTLLDLPAPQVRAVVAHEVAHAEVEDPLRGVLGVATLVLPAALLAERLRRRHGPLRPGPRLGATAVLVVLLGELAVAPVANWQSRRVESAADARALELTGEPAAAVRVARQFVTGSLADPTPPRWVVAVGGSHPTPTRRIERAVATAATTGASLPTLAELLAEEAAAARTAADAGADATADGTAR